MTTLNTAYKSHEEPIGNSVYLEEQKVTWDLLQESRRL